MTYEEFIRLVKAMRDAQKAYFAGDRGRLDDAKRLEKQVDKELKKDPRQGDLF